MKKLKLTFVEENVWAVAELLENKAPVTTAMLWEALAQPVSELAIHAMWTGRELSFPFPGACLPANALELPPENQTVIPIPGDLIWNGYHPYQWQGNPNPVYDFGIFYGRDSRLLLPVGWRPSNHFGCIVENLPAFAAVAARCQSEGRKTIRIERV